MSEREPIGVIGVGWVGLVTAVCFAEVGHRVVAMDVDEAKIEALGRCEVPIHEPGMEELLGRNAERLELTTSMSGVLEAARLLFVCVDTPPTYSGDADLSRVQAVVGELRGDGERALVMKSTVPVGTGRSIRRDLPGIAYVSCPEFLKEGSAIDDFLHPDRVVVGAEPEDQWAADAVAKIYEPLGGELIRTDIASAEMIKLASNAFLATKISFINEIANVSEEVGADVTEVARGMGLDERIGPSFLKAGIGYGGSCFAPTEKLHVRYQGGPRLVSFEQLWHLCGGNSEALESNAIAPEGVEVWSWVPGEAGPEWMPVAALTKRHHDGEMVDVQTRTGHRVRVTADHPFIVGDGTDDEVLTRVLAEDLDDSDWLPFVFTAQAGFPQPSDATMRSAEGRAISAAPQSVATAPRAKEVARADYRAFGGGELAWARFAEKRTVYESGPVFSLKVPGSQTVVTSGGLVVSQCFPKDVTALKQLAGNTGYHFQLLTAVIEVNELQKRRVMGKLTKHLGSLVGKKVALLGLAFKPDTDDMREASSLVLASRLQGEGANVSAYDPVAERPARELLPSVEFRESAAEAVEGADAVVLVTEWPEFAELDWKELRGRMANPLVVDGRNFLDPAALREAGFTYEGIGRPNSSGDHEAQSAG